MSVGSDGAHEAMAPAIGHGPYEPSSAGALQCPGCMKSFKRESELHRHWRLPIPCQIPGCTQTFRDDKLKSYVSHHMTRHNIDGQQTINQARFEEYFEIKKKEHRNNIHPDLCTIRKPKFPTTSKDASGNWPFNLEQRNSSPPGLAIGDKVAVYGLSNTYPVQATGSGLNGRVRGAISAGDFVGFDPFSQVSQLKQELSYKFQFIDYLKNTLRKAEYDIQDLERKIKIIEAAIGSGQPSLNDSRCWEEFIECDDEHREASDLQ